MKKILFLCLASTVVALGTSGCNSWSGHYSFEQSEQVPEPLPFKIKLQHVEVGTEYFHNNKREISKLDSEKNLMKMLKQHLLKKYPQYFTDKAENSITADITLIRLQKQEINDVNSFLAAISVLTLGLIPFRNTIESSWEISMNIDRDNFTAQNLLKLKRKNATSAGIIGALLQTHRWVPELANHHVCSKASPYEALINPASKKLLEFFPDLLLRIDRNVLIKYYNSKYASQVTLLE